MKKALIYALSLVILFSALTACGNSPDQGQTSRPEGPKSTASSAPPDSPKAELSEEEVRRFVLETDPEAKIAAVVPFSADAALGNFVYADQPFLVMPLSFDAPIYASEPCRAQIESLMGRNDCTGEGTLVFLNEEELPSYYVEDENVFLTRIYHSKSETATVQLVFAIRDTETLEALQKAYQQAGEEVQSYINELEQLQYFISGSVEEINEKYHYVLLNGTAEQYSTGDHYRGKIRLDYDEDGEEWVTQNHIYGISAYSWRDEEAHGDEEWNGYQGFNSAAKSFWGYSLEQAHRCIDSDINFILKFLKSTPPLEGTDYEEPLGDWVLRFTVPEEWKDICDIETAENVVSFYQKASRADMGGWLFDLAVMEGNGYLELPHYEIVTEEEGAVLVAVFPTDVQFSGEAMEEYEEMSSRITEIIDSVEFKHK